MIDLGWIKIHRKIKNHWIWKSEKRLKWWLDILLTVNHKDNEVLIGGTLIQCKRGQSVRSLESWAKDWDVTKKTVRDFFILLKSSSMISFESVQISTRITVCNYDIYNDKVNDCYTTATREQPPNKNDKNEKNEIKERERKIPPPDIFYKSEIITVIDGKDKVNYKKFIDFLFGNNKTKEPLTGVLSIPKQISFEQFMTLITNKDAKLKVADLLYTMNNDPKYYKGKQSLFLTLKKWMDMSPQFQKSK